MKDKLYEVKIKMYVVGHNKEAAAWRALHGDPDPVDIEINDAGKAIVEHWLNRCPIGGDGIKKCKDYLK